MNSLVVQVWMQVQAAVVTASVAVCFCWCCCDCCFRSAPPRLVRLGRPFCCAGTAPAVCRGLSVCLPAGCVCSCSCDSFLICAFSILHPGPVPAPAPAPALHLSFALAIRFIVHPPFCCLPLTDFHHHVIPDHQLSIDHYCPNTYHP